MKLRLATSDDIDEIMIIERMPGYEALVGRSTREEHLTMMSDPAYVYLAGCADDGTLLGFVLARDVGTFHGGVYIRRIATRTAGKGDGTALLWAVIDWAFGHETTHRVHLDHFTDNDRAHRAYAKCGMRQEGVARQAYRLPDGSFRDLAVMSILRPEWEALRRQR